jgi:ribosome biogenesis GTPase
MTSSPTSIARLADSDSSSLPVTALGWSSDWDTKRAEVESVGIPARVVRHDGVKVLVADGESVEHAGFPRSMNLAVGDWVLVHNETVTAALERSTVLERDSVESGKQVIAANVDTVLVMFGADRPLRRRKVLRFVAFAGDIGARPVVVLAKADLVADVSSLVEQLTAWLGDIPVIATSVETGEGLDRIFDGLSGATGTLIGESGAGKSSLVNALMEDEVAWIGDVREGDAKGRHTTTHRELHLLPGGGMIIDNPGIRALGLSSEGEGVEALFSELEELALSCRFRDCEHRTEPGCAILAGVSGGSIERDHWNAYLQFTAEQAAAGKRALEAERTEKARKDAASARKAREGHEPKTP